MQSSLARSSTPRLHQLVFPSIASGALRVEHQRHKNEIKWHRASTPSLRPSVHPSVVLPIIQKGDTKASRYKYVHFFVSMAILRV